MAVSYTTTYNLTKPEVGASEDQWGDLLNTNFDSIDDILDGTTAITGIDINSGTLDGVTIGGTTAGAGTFTNLTATGTTTLAGASTSANITFGDNDKAIFGAGSDLQIYHDGTHSRISDEGTGNLILKGSSAIVFSAVTNGEHGRVTDGGGWALGYSGSTKLATTSTGIDITGIADASTLFRFGVDNSEIANNYLRFKPSGAAYIDHSTVGQVINFRVSNASSLDTTPLVVSSTGVDVTGVITADGLTVDGDITLTAGDKLKFNDDRYFTPENNIDGAEISANGVFRVKTGTTPAARLLVGGNGDISFYEDTGTTPKFFWDASAESLGIGTSSPSYLIHADAATATDPSYITASSGSDFIVAMGSQNSAGVAQEAFIGTLSNDALKIKTNNTERMRIDSSGNVLVGKTSSGSGNVGGEIRPTGSILTTADGGFAAVFNRETSDGEIIRIKKDDVTVGSIGTSGGSAYIGGYQNAGLYFNGTTDFRPWNTSTQANLDNSVDLGSSSARFKDLYLSGGVYLGGTGSANKLDDYEEGTFDPTFNPSSGSVTIHSSYNTLSYIKIGKLVRITGLIIFTANTAGGTMSMSAPFTSASLTDDSERSLQPITVAGGTKAANEFFIEINPNASGFFLKWSSNSTGTFNNAASEFGTGGQLYFNFNYQTT